MRTRVLVFGDGLLGSAFKSVEGCEVLSSKQCDITKLEDIKSALNYTRPKVVINCAGVVPRSKRSIEQTFKVNSFAPHYIADQCFGKYYFIHVSTDCVFKGDRGKYTEHDEPDAVDVYGMSKLFGEPTDGLVVRTSFIGLPDPKERGLLAWASKQQNIMGYDRVFWNGITTKEFVKKLLEYAHEEITGTRHVYGYTISKYELLLMAKEVFGWKTTIYKESEEVDKPHAWDKTLSSVYSTGFITKPMRNQLEELL